jgi:GLPGLI family protein
MKNLSIFLFCSIALSITAQEKPYFDIVYNSFSMIHKTYRQPKQAFTRLFVFEDSSLYQFEKARKFDSVKMHRKATIADIDRYITKEDYAIEFVGDSLTYYDVISNTEYTYKEKITYKWSFLSSDKKIIDGYTCKKATTTYGGRNWTAWYTLKLPINAGPYKFKGLPGLIVELKDDTDSYVFILQSVTAKENLPLKKMYHESLKDDVFMVTSNRNKYNKIRFNHNSLTMGERLNLLNKVEGTTNEIKITSLSGSNPFSNTRNVRRSKRNNFIEIDHN